MRTEVTFRTGLFNAETVKDYFINDCCFGDDCARWLAERLSQDPAGQVDVEPIQGDWGWVFFVRTERFRFWIGVGLYPDDEQPPRWLVHVHRASWSFLPWLRRPADADLAKVCIALDRVLKSDQAITEVRWHHEKSPEDD